MTLQRCFFFITAIKLDGCTNVKRYTAWSLMDNLEWRAGYTEKFGLFKVDYEKWDRPRIPKASAHFYKDLVSNNGFPKSWTKRYIRQGTHALVVSVFLRNVYCISCNL